MRSLVPRDFEQCGMGVSEEAMSGIYCAIYLGSALLRNKCVSRCEIEKK